MPKKPKGPIKPPGAQTPPRPKPLTNSQILTGANMHITQKFIQGAVHGANLAASKPPVFGGGTKGSARPISRSEAMKLAWATRRKKYGAKGSK